jgi:quinol monooxygenase YgiN
MSGVVLIVDFMVKPGMRPAFRKLIDENARQSAQTEPGCRRFDVVEPEGESDRIVLYEIYNDRAAVDAHVKSSHYRAFDSESAPLVTSKKVMFCDLVCEGSVRN